MAFSVPEIVLSHERDVCYIEIGVGEPPRPVPVGTADNDRHARYGRADRDAVDLRAIRHPGNLNQRIFAVVA